MVVGRLISYFAGNFSGAMLNFQEGRFWRASHVSTDLSSSECLMNMFLLVVGNSNWQMTSHDWMNEMNKQKLL